MVKTPEQMVSDILTSLGKKEAPEGIILEIYLERCLEMARKQARKEVLEFVQPHDVDINGNIVECNYHTLSDMLTK